MQAKLIRSFILSGGGFLLAAALIRFFVGMGNAQILSLNDPVLGIPLRYAVLIAGGIELVVALLCLFGKQVGIQIAWLVLLSTNFMAYRVIQFSKNCHPQCTILGSLTDPLHLSYGATGFIARLISYYLLLGSYAAVIWFWHNGRAARLVAPEYGGDGCGLVTERVKMFCPGCGGKIQFASQDLGRKIRCPLCKTAIILQKPGFLKMSCCFCKEHIEFPAYAIGQKISCPHCNMNLIVKEPA